MRDGLRHGQSVQRDRAPMGVHIGYVESNRHGQMGGGRQRRFSYDGAGRSMVHSEVVGRGHLEKNKELSGNINLSAGGFTAKQVIAPPPAPPKPPPIKLPVKKAP